MLERGLDRGYVTLIDDYNREKKDDWVKQNVAERYDLFEKLEGKGSYGDVFKAIDVREDRIYAVKRINR